jgi:hypothetical protein
MKIAAASLTEEVLFARVTAAIGNISGQTREEIRPEARLREDLGIAGDDGHELFVLLHERFEMDWTGLDLRLHFGDAGQAAQSLTVAALIAALKAGRWPDFPAIARPRAARVRLQAASWAALLILGGCFAATLAVVLSRAGS